MSTSKSFIELSVAGVGVCEQEVTLHYEYSAAGGDGWNGPRYPAGVSLTAVELVGRAGQLIDLLPALTGECIAAIEDDLCAKHEEAMAPDPDYAREEA